MTSTPTSPSSSYGSRHQSRSGESRLSAAVPGRRRHFASSKGSATLAEVLEFIAKADPVRAAVVHVLLECHFDAPPLTR